MVKNYGWGGRNPKTLTPGLQTPTKDRARTLPTTGPQTACMDPLYRLPLKTVWK